jgi:hypothetical protein
MSPEPLRSIAGVTGCYKIYITQVSSSGKHSTLYSGDTRFVSQLGTSVVSAEYFRTFP